MCCCRIGGEIFPCLPWPRVARDSPWPASGIDRSASKCFLGDVRAPHNLHFGSRATRQASVSNGQWLSRTQTHLGQFSSQTLILLYEIVD